MSLTFPGMLVVSALVVLATTASVQFGGLLGGGKKQFTKRRL